MQPYSFWKLGPRKTLGPASEPSSNGCSVCEAHDPTREPGAGNPHVRFGESCGMQHHGEQEVETDLWEAGLTPTRKRARDAPDPEGTAPPPDSTRIRGNTSLRVIRSTKAPKIRPHTPSTTPRPTSIHATSGWPVPARQRAGTGQPPAKNLAPSPHHDPAFLALSPPTCHPLRTRSVVTSRSHPDCRCVLTLIVVAQAWLQPPIRRHQHCERQNRSEGPVRGSLLCRGRDGEREPALAAPRQLSVVVRSRYLKKEARRRHDP